MTTHIGIGFSKDYNHLKAARDAAFNAKTNLAQDKIDFAIIYCTVHYDPKLIFPVINQVLGNTKTVGCSTAGIILSDKVQTRGIGILAYTSDDVKCGTGFFTNITPENTKEAGFNFAQNTIADFGRHTRQLMLFMMNSHIKNPLLFLKSMQEVLGTVFPIVGAGSCDDFQFTKSYEIYHNQTITNSATGLLLGGHLAVGIGGHHGWRPLGKPHIIHKTTGNIINTIDGKKAVSLYENYFEEESAELLSTKLGQTVIFYPLGIYSEEGNEYLLRNATKILPDGSIVCQGAIPQGVKVHLMIGNKDSCKQAAEQAAIDAKNNLGAKEAKLVLVISSMARLKLLGRNAYQEIKRIRNVFGEHIPLFGMYSNGEICPFKTKTSIHRPHLQNESIVVVALS